MRIRRITTADLRGARIIRIVPPPQIIPRPVEPPIVIAAPPLAIPIPETPEVVTPPTVKPAPPMKPPELIPTVVAPPDYEPPKKKHARATAVHVQNKRVIRQLEKARMIARGWETPRGHKRALADVIADGAWNGERCFIIGGGASLRGFDFERLRGQGRVIAVNRAFEFAPFADAMVSMDNRFYNWIMRDQMPGIRERYANFRGLKIWLDLLNYQYGPEVHYVKGLARFGVSRSLRPGIYHSNNSGFCGLQIALALGANPIYLLGFDMMTGNASHFHVGYPIQSPPSVSARFRTGFESIAGKLEEIGIDVINLNPSSGLRCFKFATLDAVLKKGPTDDQFIIAENNVAS